MSASDILESIFFGYPGKPEHGREIVSNGANHIRSTGLVAVQTWEDLRIEGRIIIGRIEDAIDAAAVAAFDVTCLNLNVLFEVGFAIGRGKPIWLARDTSMPAVERRWKEFGLLENVGYSNFQNAYQLRDAFLAAWPDVRNESVYADLLGSSLAGQPGDPAVLFVRQPVPTEADRQLSTRIDREQLQGIKRIVADPRESPAESLSWYAAQCANCTAAVVHLLGPERQGAEVHNARCALVAGIAHGMGRKLLMLAPDSLEPSMDFKEIFYGYSSARDCRQRAASWLTRELKDAYEVAEARRNTAISRVATSRLASIRLGEPVAENEATTLSEYYVPTTQYLDVLKPQSAVFVGRKGMGKTAAMLQASRHLAEDRRNVVCVLQPADYDLEGILRISQVFEQPDAKSFLIDALWKYLLIDQIARTIRDDLEDRPAPVSEDDPEWQLIAFLRSQDDLRDDGLAERLSRAVAQIGNGRELTLSEERAVIAKALHSERIKQLVDLVVPVLRGKSRVALLVDNLDQSWGHGTDIDAIGRLLLGLLSAARTTADDLTKRLRGGISVTSAVFMRSDIYFHLKTTAREPDKLPARFMRWDSEEVLLQVVEERHSALSGEQLSEGEFWKRFFDEEVFGQTPQSFIASRVLARPRDVLRMVGHAIESAVRNKRRTVSAADLQEAERLYSQFAFESLVVEGSVPIPRLEDVLFEFGGAPAHLVQSDALRRLLDGGIEGHDAAMAALDQLASLSFFGVQVDEQEFRYPEDPREMKQFAARARQYVDRQGGEPVLQIHPAYRAFLEVA